MTCSSFNVDFNASDSRVHNFRTVDYETEEHAGLSAFARHDGAVYHTYSAFSRGLDIFNGAYQLLDLAPKGRDEDALEYTAAWLQRHDEY